MTPRSAPEAPRAIKRCAIYTRKSTSVGLNDEYSSLDAQRDACAAYIQHQPGWTLLDTRYDDGGRTGANIDRPAFQRLLADAEARRLDVVVVYKVDRLSRSLLDFVTLMQRFERLGIEFVSVTQHFSTSTPLGRLTLNILLSFAEFEREMISERTRDKIAAARRRGMWTGGPVPLGYVVEAKKLVIDELEAVLVRDIFALYAEQRSALSVVRALQERGQRAKPRRAAGAESAVGEGRAWTRNDVLRVLKNPIYAGYMLAGNELCEGEHSAIIERVVFARTQAQLAAAAPDKGATVRNYDYLLRGILYCAPCGSAFTPASTTTHGKQYRYYRCVKRDKEGRETCPSAPLPAEAIEAHVIERIREAVADRALADDVAASMQSRIHAHRATLLTERQALPTQIASLTREAGRLIDTLADAREATRRPIEERLQATEDRRAHCKERLVAVDRELAHLDAVEVESGWVATCLRNFSSVWDELTPLNRARLVRAVVEHVEVDEPRNCVKVHLADLAPEPPEPSPPLELAAGSSERAPAAAAQEASQ